MKTNKKGRFRCNGATLLTAYYPELRAYINSSHLGIEKTSHFSNEKNQGIQSKEPSQNDHYPISPHAFNVARS